VHGHRIQHLVAEHHAGKSGRQAVEPRHAFKEMRHPRRERVAAPLAKICGELEDEIVARRPSCALQLLEQGRRERAAARAHLEYLVEPRVQHLSHLAREGLAVERRNLGCRDEIPGLAELLCTGAVVAETGRVKRKLHVAREADPAAARRDFAADVLRDAIAVLARLGRGFGERHGKEGRSIPVSF